MNHHASDWDFIAALIFWGWILAGVMAALWAISVLVQWALTAMDTRRRRKQKHS